MQCMFSHIWFWGLILSLPKQGIVHPPRTLPVNIYWFEALVRGKTRSNPYKPDLRQHNLLLLRLTLGQISQADLR